MFNRETDKLYVIHDRGNLRVVIKRADKVVEITRDVAHKCSKPLKSGNEMEVLETLVRLIPTMDEVTLAG